MTNKKNQNIIKKYAVYGIIFMLIVAVFSSGLLYYKKYRNSDKEITSDTPTVNSDGINFNPPTEQEKQQVEDNKQTIANEQHNQPTTDPVSGLKKVSPIITYAGQYNNVIEVGGYVANVIENHGTCTLKLSKSNITKTVSVNATSNASSTDCSVMSLTRSELEPGAWNATVIYTSSTSAGTSEPRSIEVK